MSEFIETNRRFFKTLSGVLGLVSWILLVLGIVWAGLKSIGLFSRLGDWQALREFWKDVPSGIFLFILLGLVGRGMAQLLRYMHDPEFRPQWLLRHGDKLLYVYAALYSAHVLLDFYVEASAQWSDLGAHRWLLVLVTALILIYALAATLILVGLGQILKRLMPVIDDAHTLA